MSFNLNYLPDRINRPHCFCESNKTWTHFPTNRSTTVSKFVSVTTFCSLLTRFFLSYVRGETCVYHTIAPTWSFIISPFSNTLTIKWWMIHGQWLLSIHSNMTKSPKSSFTANSSIIMNMVIDIWNPKDCWKFSDSWKESFIIYKTDLKH